jgi:ribonuclease HI
MKKITIYTDGACKGNPGPGGWGALLICGDIEKELSGHEAQTTNNRMEMTAVIKALEALKTACIIDLYTDSTYVRDGITKWIVGWQQKGWQTTDKKPVKNIDLWQALLTAIAPHEIAWHWVKGHADNNYNNRVDSLASEASLIKT